MSKLIDTHLDGANELVWTRDDVEVARLSSANVFTFPPGALGGSMPFMWLDAWGHSYIEGQSVKANRFASKLARRLGVDFWGERNRGFSGMSAANSNSNGSWGYLLNEFNSQGSMPYIPGGPTWQLPNSQIVVIAAGINDLNTLDARTVAANADPIKQAIRAVVSRYRAGAIRENSDSTVVQAGTWSSNTTPDPPINSSFNYALSTANGSTMTLTLPADLPPGITVALGFAAEASMGGTWTITKNGVAHGSIVAVNPNASFGSLPFVYRLTGCQPGDVIVATLSGVATRSIFDYWQTEAGTETNPVSAPPLVLILKQPRLPDYSAYPSGLVTDASVANLNLALDAIATEFGSSVVTVDVDSLLNRTTAYFASDKLHPSDLGHSIIANALYGAIQSNLRNIPTVFADPNPAPYIGSFNGHAGIEAPTCRGWYHNNLLLIAARTYFARVTVERPMNLTNVKLKIATAATNNDNVEIVLYRVLRNGHMIKLFGTGVTAAKLNSGTGAVSLAMAANCVLQPGIVYQIAVQCPAVGGTAATVARADFTDAKYVSGFGLTWNDVDIGFIDALGTPLPSTITTAPGVSGNAPVVVLSEV